MKYRGAFLTGTAAAVLFLAFFSGGCMPDGGAAPLGGGEVDPRAVAFLRQAQAAFERQQLTQALALADSAAAYDPDYPATFYLRGQVFMAMNRFGDADAAFGRTLELNPNFRGVWFQRGTIALLQGQSEQAVSLYEKERDLILNTPAEQKRFYEHIDQDLLPAAWIQIGRSYGALGNADQAREAYEQALKLDSTRADAHNWLSVLKEENGELDQAIAHARRALDLDPQNAEYRYRAGMLLNRTGKSQEAVGLLRSVVQENPWHEGAHYNLGQAFLRLGQKEAGEYYLSRIDTLRLLRQEVGEAQAAVHQQPGAPGRWKQLGIAFLKSGQYEEARKALGVALHLDPNDWALQNDMANLSLALGDTLDAVQRYESILAHDSTQTDVWLNLGVVYAYAKEYSLARRAWQTALRHQPGHQEAKAYLAQLPAGR